MSIKKMIYLITMTLILCIMTLGYAALQERIDVELEASIDSTYRVEITRVQEGTVNGDARSVQVPSYTNDSNNMTATFNIGLTNDTDYITYTIQITNYSTIDIRVNEIEINKTNNNMKVSKIGITNGDIILSGGTKTFTVKIKLTDTTSEEQTGTITILPQVTRLKGGLGSVVEETYDSYVIGDIVEFAGSNWYVIEDSSSSSDYVTLLKDKALSQDELGSYAIRYFDENNNGRIYDSTAFYWSDTCHRSGTYGTDTYDSDDLSGCTGHNDYAGSKIRELLEGTYINTLGAFSLKEVDGYKIRIMKKAELEDNFGFINNASTDDTPTWIYVKNAASHNISYYWLMDSVSSQENDTVYNLYHRGKIFKIWVCGVNGSYVGVRPVINLYKASID